mmetsp:Transcript_30059/g.71537  ORF Transcript_30059/g.71537 Transcript_30059/m.71537 type:complete len:276 (-) Transcript_30059:221-1048(-)
MTWHWQTAAGTRRHWPPSLADKLMFLNAAGFSHKRHQVDTRTMAMATSRRLRLVLVAVLTACSHSWVIEEVTTRRRALDVLVFQGSSATADEYATARRGSGGGVPAGEDDAIDALTDGFDDRGRFTGGGTPFYYEPQVYFIAAASGGGRDAPLERQRGVIGSVSAQLRRRSPLIAGGGDAAGAGRPPPSVPMPAPHVYVADMLVHATARRLGVGGALLRAVSGYTRDWEVEMDERIPMVLSVDSDNGAARSLYEQFGFDYLEENDIFCVMVYNIH